MLRNAPADGLEPSIAKTMSGAVPGLSVAVVTPGGPVWQKGFGFADAGKRMAAAPDTVYPWFSMTKIATATAIMQLTERGGLDLDDPVASHYPAFGRLCPAPWAKAATIRNLLNHSSGLANPIPIAWVHTADQPPKDQASFLAARLAKAPKLRFPPGATARYSNLGFLVLGEIVAAASGRPYADYVRENILRPLGMSRTDFVYTPEMLAVAATGYQKRWSAMALLLHVMAPPGVIGPAVGNMLSLNRFYLDGAAYGGLVGSAQDAARFLRVHLNGGEADGRRILSADSVAAMQRISVRGKALDMGLGWFRRRTERGRIPESIEHLGGGAGFFNVMRLYPGAGLGVIVMGNATSYDYRKIVDAAARKWLGGHG